MAHSDSKVLSFKTEEIIATTIPAKISTLDKLFKSDMFDDKQISKISCDIKIPKTGLPVFKNTNNDNDVNKPGKKRKFEEDTDISSIPSTIPINSNLTPMIQALKPEIQELIRTCAKVQMWIQLLIPKIEDGNNFGVSIQEEILNEVNRIQTEATGYLDQISRYYITRGKLLSKVAKYPYLDDYRRTIKEVDEKEFGSLQMNCCELRNHYLMLLDSISKNFEKIKRPRSCNTDSMY
eukprot:gene3772-4295_t